MYKVRVIARKYVWHDGDGKGETVETYNDYKMGEYEMRSFVHLLAKYATDTVHLEISREEDD